MHVSAAPGTQRSALNTHNSSLPPHAASFGAIGVATTDAAIAPPAIVPTFTLNCPTGPIRLERVA